MRAKTREKANKVLKAIEEYIEKHDGCTPSASEIAEMTGIPKHSIPYYLDQLEIAGKIKRVSPIVLL